MGLLVGLLVSPKADTRRQQTPSILVLLFTSKWLFIRFYLIQAVHEVTLLVPLHTEALRISTKRGKRHRRATDRYSKT